MLNLEDWIAKVREQIDLLVICGKDTEEFVIYYDTIQSMLNGLSQFVIARVSCACSVDKRALYEEGEKFEKFIKHSMYEKMADELKKRDYLDITREYIDQLDSVLYRGTMYIFNKKNEGEEQ